MIEIPTLDDDRVLRFVELGDTGFRVLLWTTHRTDARGCTVLGYAFFTPDRTTDELRHATLFAGEDFCGSPMWADDADETVRALLGFLTLRPGDTDREYFARYTAEQLEFAATDAEELALFAFDGDDPSDVEGYPLCDLDPTTGERIPLEEEG